MVAAQAAGRDLEAVETRNRAVQETMRAWNQERPCGPRCGEPSWTMARSQQSRNEHRVSADVLRLDRSSTVVDRCVAQSSEPPDADPLVRWFGRGGEVTLPPMPIDIYGSPSKKLQT